MDNEIYEKEWSKKSSSIAKQKTNMFYITCLCKLFKHKRNDCILNAIMISC